MKPIRILQVAGRMNRGGTEAWLMQLLRHMNPELFAMDFLVFTEGEGPYDREIHGLGSRILRCPEPRHALQFTRVFHDLVQLYGPYDVVHSHIHFMNGFVMRVAAMAGIQVRIPHSHMSSEDRQVGAFRHCYRRLMRRWIHQYSTLGVACSEPAAATLFGADWRSFGNYRILHCGVDLSAFHTQPDAGMRRRFNIPENAIVIGHVGRFEHQKNHQFLIEIAKHVVGLSPSVRFLLAGDGPLHSHVMELARVNGIANNVIFTGVLPNVAQVMNSCMDVFVLPSIHEGLPIVGLEAQAAGLPCLFASSITREVKVLPTVSFLSLSLSAEEWARELIRAAVRPRVPLREAVAALSEAGFSDSKSAGQMFSVYCFATAVQTAVA